MKVRDTMLLLFRSISGLKYSLLMEVYEEENRKKANDAYSQLAEYEALALVEQEFYCYLRDVFFKNKDSFCAVWEQDGTYKAALRMEPFQDGYLLTGLSTAPSARRKGYASKLLRLTLDSLPSGSKIYSHVEKTNTASIALHEKCGFSRKKEYGVMLDRSVLHNFWTFLYG